MTRPAAQRYYLLGLHASREAGAHSLAAKIVSDMMKLSTSLGNYRDSLNLAKVGLYVLPSHDDTAVRAELLGCEARAYAHTGANAHTEAVRSIESCLSIWHAQTHEPLPNWLHYMDQSSGSEVDTLAANAYTQLALTTHEQTALSAHFTERAEQHVMNARRARNNLYKRSSIIDELRLARLRLAQHEPVEAINVATQALATVSIDQVCSVIVNGWLIQFHSDLTGRHPKFEKASYFTTQLRDHLRSASPERIRK